VVRRVRTKLDRSRLHLADQDLDACYNEAWRALCERVSAGGAKPESLVGWLIEVTYCRAIDELRKLRPGRFAPLDEESQSQADDDLAERADDRWTLDLLFDVARHGFSPLHARIIVLTCVFGLPRAQVAEHVGVSLKRLHKILDGHKGKEGLRRKLERCIDVIAAGRCCEQYSSAMIAYRLGWVRAGSASEDRIHGHLRVCPACRSEAADRRV
jgi:DNA-directed RNA polymerase specialized sigma24 family protein